MEMGLIVMQNTLQKWLFTEAVTPVLVSSWTPYQRLKSSNPSWLYEKEMKNSLQAWHLWIISKSGLPFQKNSGNIWRLKKQPSSHPSDCRWEQLLLLLRGDSKKGHLPHFLKMRYIHSKAFANRKKKQFSLICTTDAPLFSFYCYHYPSLLIGIIFGCLWQTNTISDPLKGKQRFRELRMAD